MTVGIMQPYAFPYIGYFQLIKAVDTFVFYDDVNFIKQGWINRNRILLNGQPFMFTIPLNNASSFAKINAVMTDDKSYAIWTSKFMRTLHQAYKKAPFYDAVRELVHSCLRLQSGSIGDLAKRSVREICGYLGISTAIIDSSNAFGNSDLTAADRVIDICRRLNGNAYINAIGGQELYSSKDFSASGIVLRFIQPTHVEYNQGSAAFVPWLSIIDALMYNSVNETNKLVDQYKLI